MRVRAAGLLMHVSSIPGPYGIGDMGPQAFAFVDFLKASGVKYWQVLPVNPTDGINGHSPYSSPSAFAGNPLFISPELLVSEGWLTRGQIKPPKGLHAGRVEYPAVIAFKERLLALACRQFAKEQVPGDFDAFIQANPWIEDYALFVAAKAEHQGRSWNEWPRDLKQRKPAALKKLALRHKELVHQAKFTQYVFYRQWMGLKAYANRQGIAVIGDIPIYVNYDSVDVWCSPKYFKLHDNGEIKFVSGCPPDYFSKTGQRWGNPVYDWARLKKDGYGWWVARIKHNLVWFDYLRIDHFRGFLSFWQIPAQEKLAVFGRWVKGPGNAFFAKLAQKLGKINIIAEDLGEITPDVPKLMKKFHIPGMRVMLFAFGGNIKKNPHVPANYPVEGVVYTGTHDNNTVQGWYRAEAKPYERANVAAVLGKKVVPATVHWQMIDALMRSRANTAIVPVPDVLGLGVEGRMNTPATKVGNWQWRLLAGQCTQALAKKLHAVVRSSGRGK